MSKQNLLSSVIRFLEPVREAKFYSFQQVFKWVLSWTTPFIHVLFAQKIVFSIESGNSDRSMDLLMYYLVYVILYELVHGGTYFWWWFWMDPEIHKLLWNRYISKYIQLDNTLTEKIGTGKAISIIDKWIDTWASGLTRMLWNGSWLIASFAIALYYLWTIHLLWSLLFLCIFIWSLIFSSIMNDRMIGLRKKRNEQVHLHTKHLVRLIMSKFEVMQGDNMKDEKERLSKYMDISKKYNLRMSPYFHAFYHGPYFLLVLLKIWFLYYISLQIFSWSISIATFVWVFAIMLILEKTVMNFIDFFKNFTKEFAMVESLWDFLDSTPKTEGYEEGTTFKHTRWEIKLKDITYGYTPENPIFKDLSLDLKWKQITALVGPSWGGKSTLVKLISWYIKQDSGDIIVDKQNLSEVSLKSYYQDIGYLTQEPSVFDGTVIENLLYAVNWSPSKKKIKEIIESAHCEFIYDLPDELETEIGERWVKLSWGQKQRLAIAKIFLKDPKIIILDEPTSALDSISEQKITEAMHNLFKGRTVIIIAHRLQTVKHADDIIVIEAGEVIERGTHTSLIRKKGYYKQMLDLQSGF